MHERATSNVRRRLAVCCSALQCVAVCCSVLQCVAVRCSALQCVAVRCSASQCLAVCSNLLLAGTSNVHTSSLSIHKLQVSFAEYSPFYRALLQKRPIILRSLLSLLTCTHPLFPFTRSRARTRKLALSLSLAPVEQDRRIHLWWACLVSWHQAQVHLPST